MEFRIADTFTDSLARLTGDEQKVVKTTAFDLQMDPSNPGMSFHKLDRARDKSFWSVRASGDLRLIVHRAADSLLLCYVGHHEDAYAWAERRKLETHPKTGAAQLVEIRETVQEVVRDVEVPRLAPPRPRLFSWEAYRDVPRLGRRTRLPESRREALWTIFERVRTVLRERGLVTDAGLYRRVADHLTVAQQFPYDFAVVDEAQDVSVPQLRFLAALGGGRPDGLFFAGDLGQRIFQLPFSWRSLGVDIRGRSATLRINYRTSHQIRAQADRLLGIEIADVDGNTERRDRTISVFNGPAPTILGIVEHEEERTAVGCWLAERAGEGVRPEEMAVFVRAAAQLPRAIAAVGAAKLEAAPLDEHVHPSRGHVAIGTMHLSRGLEFRAVAVMACDDDVVSLQERIEAVADQADLEEVYNTERHLLYVAGTRARDFLLVSGVKPASEFLSDLRP